MADYRSVEVELRIETLRLSGLPATLDHVSMLQTAQSELVRLLSDGPVPAALATEWQADVVSVAPLSSGWPATSHSAGVAIANAIYQGIKERGT